MPVTKQPEPTLPKADAKKAERKPWKKKTPTEILIDQIERMRSQIAEREEELKDLRRQLQKFEEARKIFETA